MYSLVTGGKPVQSCSREKCLLGNQRKEYLVQCFACATELSALEIEEDKA